MKDIKAKLELFTIGAGLVMSAFMTYIILLTVYRGSTTIVIWFDKYGEQTAEAIVFPFVTLLLIGLFASKIRRYVRGE